MRVKEVSELVGISVRTLHHYDEIGLLIPEEVTEAGYRVYSQGNIQQLQQILFFRELGFSLKKIKEIIHDSAFDKQEALELQRKLLLKKEKQIGKLIKTIDKSLLHMKGEIEMTNKEKFSGFDFSQNPYEEEARQRWGDKKIDESNEKIKSKSKKELKEFENQFNEIYQKLAEIRHEQTDSKIAQQEIHEWYTLLNTMGDYSPEAFKNLGEMYVMDERFTKNIDQFGEGLAMFMRDAMSVYADNLEK